MTIASHKSGDPAAADTVQLTVLCLASEVKGHAFIRECHRLGCRVLLVTREMFRDAEWPRESISEMYFLPSLMQREDLLKGVSWMARTERIDRIVALDDFDVELAALLREHLRVPGMGDTTARYFRDKLAMRVRAREVGIDVPDFVHALNDKAIEEFTRSVPAPWMLKPRSEGSAAGIKKVGDAEAVFRQLDQLGDLRSFYVLERYIPGDVYHVDATVSEREIPFIIASKYARPPIDVAHGGGMFVTRTLAPDHPEAEAVNSRTKELIGALGLVRGVTHTEWIRSREDGTYYFLETAARVGGAHIAETVEAATGINLWAEWAKIEVGGADTPYVSPVPRAEHAGIVLSLARQEWPDTSAYNDAEIVYRVNKRFHAGLIVKSNDSARVDQLIDGYTDRFAHDYLAVQPALEKLSR